MLKNSRPIPLQGMLYQLPDCSCSSYSRLFELISYFEVELMTGIEPVTSSPAQGGMLYQLPDCSCSSYSRLFELISYFEVELMTGIEP
ncbi:MAG TPA: hypothetical protein PK605_09590, partial [Ignavibacteria bacterium]|nr:hypothetical protein [Ignavibacteria bacterium]